MKTKDYIAKYHLDQPEVHFDHNEFIVDFTAEFMTLLETQKGLQSFAGFEAAVRCIRQKWEAIRKQSQTQPPDKLWGYFFATVVGPMREKHHAVAWAKKREERKERMTRGFAQEDFIRRYGPRLRVDTDFSDIFGAFGFDFKRFVKNLIGEIKAPLHRDLTIMGMATDGTVTVEQVKNRYREMAKLYHPDVGGDHQKFIELTEAKNRLLLRLGDRDG